MIKRILIAVFVLGLSLANSFVFAGEKGGFVTRSNFGGWYNRTVLSLANEKITFLSYPKSTTVAVYAGQQIAQNKDGIIIISAVSYNLSKNHYPEKIVFSLMNYNYYSHYQLVSAVSLSAGVRDCTVWDHNGHGLLISLKKMRGKYPKYQFVLELSVIE